MDEDGDVISPLIQREIDLEGENSDNEILDAPALIQCDSDSESGDSDILPPLMEQGYGDSSDDNSSDDDERNESNISNLQRKKPSVPKARGILKASFNFILVDKNGVRSSFLGLLDTESTGSLINNELVEKYSMKNNGMWSTNTDNF